MKSAFRPTDVPQGLPGAADPLAPVTTFAGGFDDRVSPENVQPGTSNDMLDVEVSLNDRLIRAPGVGQVELDLDHTPAQILAHPGFRYSSAMIMLAPPYIGIRENGISTLWYNVGLRSGPYGWTDFAGVLLLSNGTSSGGAGILSRQPQATTLVPVAGSPAALGLTTFGGRVVLGGTIVAGDFDLMGIGWSDATSDYAGWDPDQGAGSESMIGSMKRADRFMAFASMGFDQLAIVNRRSIWIATRTGDVFEPFDIKPRLEDTGTTHAATVYPTEYGPILLSDDGVKIFDGQAATMVSEPINSQLGTIRETDAYSASFNPQRKRYYLHTPTETWVFDLNKKRWYRWAAQFLMSLWFPDQDVSGPTWDGATGTWDAQTKAWWQLEPQESNGSMYFVRGVLLGTENPAIENVFGTPLNSRWFGQDSVSERMDQQMTHTQVYLTYESVAQATVEIWLPDTNGNYELVTTATLAATGSEKIGRRVAIPTGVPIHTGRGVGLGLRITSGFPRIRRGSVQYQPAGVI